MCHIFGLRLTTLLDSKSGMREEDAVVWWTCLFTVFRRQCEFGNNANTMSHFEDHGEIRRREKVAGELFIYYFDSLRLTDMC